MSHCESKSLSLEHKEAASLLLCGKIIVLGFFDGYSSWRWTKQLTDQQTTTKASNARFLFYSDRFRNIRTILFHCFSRDEVCNTYPSKGINENCVKCDCFWVEEVKCFSKNIITTLVSKGDISEVKSIIHHWCMVTLIQFSNFIGQKNES